MILHTFAFVFSMVVQAWLLWRLIESNRTLDRLKCETAEAIARLELTRAEASRSRRSTGLRRMR